jgi:o-succinylbenzoate synthase
VRLQFARPVSTARGEFTGRASVLLELRDPDGVAGYGEAAPWPGFGTESSDEALAKLRSAQAMLCGMAVEPGEWPAPLAAHLRDAPAARAAVQGALWDLAARRAGRPLADHLADCVGPMCGATLHRVPVSALLLARDAGALRDEAARARTEGHRAAKLKLGGVPLAADVDRARAAREGLGAEVALRGDANGAWNWREAAEALEALEQFGFDYIEQPLPAGDIEGLAGLRRHAPVRLAADESVATEQGAVRLIAAGAVDVVVLKPATLGGPVRALAIAVEAHRAGMRVVFSHTFETAVGARHVLNCAAAWGDPAGVHGLGTAELFVADVAEPVQCRGGCAEVAVAPGLGVAP